MKTIKMNVVEFRLLASSNYSCVNKQDVHVATYRSTCVELAVARDETRARAISERGCSGIGAGARLVAIVDDPDNPGETVEIDIDGLPSDVLDELPLGSIWHLYRAAARLARDTTWDGHNHIRITPCACRELIARIKDA